MDSNFSWKPHVTYVLNSVSSFIPLFYRLREILNETTLILLLKATLLPKIQYGLIVYGNGVSSLLSPIKKFINKVIRVIFRLGKRDHVEDKCKEHRIIHIVQAYFMKLCRFAIMVQRGHRNVTELVIARNVKVNGGYYLRERKAPLLNILRPRNNLDRYHINYRIVKTLNYFQSCRSDLFDIDNLTINPVSYNVKSWIFEVNINDIWETL